MINLSNPTANQNWSQYKAMIKHRGYRNRDAREKVLTSRVYKRFQFRGFEVELLKLKGRKVFGRYEHRIKVPDHLLHLTKSAKRNKTFKVINARSSNYDKHGAKYDAFEDINQMYSRFTLYFVCLVKPSAKMCLVDI